LKNNRFWHLVINFATVHDFVKPVSYGASRRTGESARNLSLQQQAAGKNTLLITTETQNYA